MSAADLLQQLDRLDVRLSIDADRLVIDAPAGVVTPELRSILVSHKPELLAALRQIPAPEYFDDERTLLAQASPALRATVEAIKTEFADLGAGVEVVDVQPPRYVATNPVRQRVIDLLLPIFRADPDRAMVLRDQWQERLAIVAADEDCRELAEDVAFDELTTLLEQPTRRSEAVDVDRTSQASDETGVASTSPGGGDLGALCIDTVEDEP